MAVETRFESLQPASPETWSVTVIPASPRSEAIDGKFAGLGAGRSATRVPQPARSAPRSAASRTDGRPLTRRDIARGYHCLVRAALAAPVGPRIVGLRCPGADGRAVLRAHSPRRIEDPVPEVRPFRALRYESD